MRLSCSWKVSCLILLLFTSAKLSAQVGKFPQACGDMSAQLDAIVNKAGPSDTLIVIVQLGENETNQDLNLRRSHNIKAYLTKYRLGSVFALRPDNIVLAYAERTDGLARLSLYLKGELVSVFFVSKNQDLFVGECVFDTEKFNNICDVDEQKIFYPCLDNGTKGVPC